MRAKKEVFSKISFRKRINRVVQFGRIAEKHLGHIGVTPEEFEKLCKEYAFNEVQKLNDCHTFFEQK